MTTMNRIEVDYITCSPQPARGYNIGYRVQGSSGAYIDAGNFFISPAVFYDHINPAGTCYEGYVRSDCGNSLFGTLQTWDSCGGGGGSGSGYRISLIGTCLPAGIQSSYLVSGGTTGDIVTVQAAFSGILQKNINNFTKACLGIACVDGVSDPILCSTCYSDAGIHGFSLTRNTVITMPGGNATVILDAVIHNGSTSPTSASMTIIDINGVPANISVSACRGNSGTGGTC